MQTWKDIKCKTRKRAVQVRAGMKATGNAVALNPLTPIELRTLNIIGPETSFGIEEVEELAFEVILAHNKQIF